MTAAELRKWRDDKGWTQERAAAWYGCSVRSWRRYERGEKPVPTPLANRIGASR